MRKIQSTDECCCRFKPYLEASLLQFQTVDSGRSAPQFGTNHSSSQFCVSVVPQGVHQPGDPGGHRDQTQPPLPDQWGGPDPSPGLRCHGNRLRRGGASGLQLQTGRRSLRLRPGTVAGGVDEGGAPGRHAGSAGEHPQRLGDVGHAVGRHRRADVRRLWLPSPQKLPPAGGGAADSASVLPDPEPLHRRPSLSHRQQRHPVRLREPGSQDCTKKNQQQKEKHSNPNTKKHLFPDVSVFFPCFFFFMCRFNVSHNDRLLWSVSVDPPVTVRVLPLRFLRRLFMFTPWCKMPWLLQQKKKVWRIIKKKIIKGEVQNFPQDKKEIRRGERSPSTSESGAGGDVRWEWMWTRLSWRLFFTFFLFIIYIQTQTRTTMMMMRHFFLCAWVRMSHRLEMWPQEGDKESKRSCTWIYVQRRLNPWFMEHRNIWLDILTMMATVRQELFHQVFLVWTWTKKKTQTLKWKCQRL